MTGLTRDALRRIGVPESHLDDVLKELQRTVALVDTAHASTTRQHVLRSAVVDRLGVGRVAHVYEDAVVGRHRIRHFWVSPQDEAADRIRSVLSSSNRGRWTPTGVYCTLKRGGDPDGDPVWSGTTVMSDTPDEINDLYEFWASLRNYNAERVLIHGLGLGCALRLALAQRSVEHIDVVELDEDVLALVGPYYDKGSRLICGKCRRVELVHHAVGSEFFCCGRRMTRHLFRDLVDIHHGDAYTFKFPPGTRWAVAWHDIWDHISGDNDFATLHRRYGGRVSWQGSWCRALAERS